MRFVPVLGTVLVSAVISLSNAHSQNKTEGLGNIVRYAETASLRALNFSQGDLASLVDAKNDFTASGWNEFMKGLDGWLNENGAPKFSSNFSPSGAAATSSKSKERFASRFRAFCDKRVAIHAEVFQRQAIGRKSIFSCQRVR